jgi:hypothetical protein
VYIALALEPQIAPAVAALVAQACDEACDAACECVAENDAGASCPTKHQAEEEEADRTCRPRLVVALEVVELHMQTVVQAVQTGIHRSHVPQGWLHTTVVLAPVDLPLAQYHRVHQQRQLQDSSAQQTNQELDLVLVESTKTDAMEC